jgi:hypothetical protein
MTTIPVTGGQRLRVDDVLLAGETPDGPALVSIEALVVDEAGLTIIGPRPGVERLVAWSDISGFGGFAPAALPNGAAASALVVDVRGRSLRFLLPDATVSTSTIDGLGREIHAHLGQTPDAPPEPPVAPAPTPVARPRVVDAPVAHASPTPQMPPIGALRPVGDGRDAVPGAPVPPRAVAVPPSAAPVPVPNAAESTMPPDPSAATDAAPVGGDLDGTEDLAVVTAPKRDRRRRGVRSSRSTVARPLLAADEFEFSSDPDLPRGGPPPGAVIEVTRRHPSTRRILALSVALALVVVGAGGWYYSKHHSLPLFGSSGPPVNGARDLSLATTTVIQPSDLSGWTALPVTGSESFAMGATSSVAADQASAGASTVLAVCLRVSPTTLSAATGVSGTTVPQRTAVANSRVYADSVGDAASSETDVMDSSSVVTADAKVFANAALFSTCYQPYVQAMLPYLSTLWGGKQVFDTATVAPTNVPSPPLPGERAYGFEITLFGHSGDAGTTASLTDVAIFGGRFQSTMSLYSNLVFPVNALASLIGSTESRVAAVADR